MKSLTTETGVDDRQQYSLMLMLSHDSKFQHVDLFRVSSSSESLTSSASTISLSFFC